MIVEAVLSVLSEFKSVGFGWLFPCQMEAAARFFFQKKILKCLRKKGRASKMYPGKNV